MLGLQLNHSAYSAWTHTFWSQITISFCETCLFHVGFWGLATVRCQSMDQVGFSISNCVLLALNLKP